MLIPRPTPPRRDEQGIAMIVTMLVMLVCVILVAASIQLAIHSNQRSGLSRDQTAALDAAEAGIDAELSVLANSSACPAAGSVVPLPDQNLPAESYKVLAPISCTVGGNAVIASVGYVPSATNPVATMTLVAHVDRGQGAPVSGGTNGGYVFPDAIFSGSTITAAAAAPLAAYGTGGSIPNVTGDGAISITGPQLDGSVHGWGTVNLTVPEVGGAVVGNGVVLTGATVQAGAGGLVSAGTLTLANTTVNGSGTYGSVGGYTASGSTVTGGVTQQTTTLPTARQMPTFTDNQSDFEALTGASSPSTSCPGTGTGSYYDISGLLTACTYNPPTINGTVVIIVHGLVNVGLTVNVPQTTTGGQLYVIDANGIGDSLTINGSNSTLPVFAYTDGALTVNGGVSGQLVGGTVATTGATTLTFTPPATPAPDFAFNNQIQPGGLGYAATVSYEYQCPGTVAC